MDGPILYLILSLTTDIRSPSGLEMSTLIPLNILKPLFYVLDIIKDIVQLLLLLASVGGLKFALKYWSSFSSGVSRYA